MPPRRTRDFGSGAAAGRNRRGARCAAPAGSPVRRPECDSPAADAEQRRSVRHVQTGARRTSSWGCPQRCCEWCRRPRRRRGRGVGAASAAAAAAAAATTTATAATATSTVPVTPPRSLSLLPLLPPRRLYGPPRWRVPGVHRCGSGRRAGAAHGTRGGAPPFGALPRAGALTLLAAHLGRRGALGQRRAAAATSAKARQRRTLGGGTAVRTGPLPTAVPVRGVRRLALSPRGWLHVGTGGVGDRLPLWSCRWYGRSVPAEMVEMQ